MIDVVTASTDALVEVKTQAMNSLSIPNLAKKEETPANAPLVVPTVDAAFNIELCPDCLEGQVIPEGRCKHCILCGWSACSI
jgi:hypothetical protein